MMTRPPDPTGDPRFRRYLTKFGIFRPHICSTSTPFATTIHATSNSTPCCGLVEDSIHAPNVMDAAT